MPVLAHLLLTHERIMEDRDEAGALLALALTRIREEPGC
jgi:hypothetical protein